MLYKCGAESGAGGVVMEGGFLAAFSTLSKTYFLSRQKGGARFPLSLSFVATFFD